MNDAHLAAGLVGTELSVQGCGSEAHDEGGDARPDIAFTTAHWTYEGEEGPEHWGELDEAYGPETVAQMQR